MENPNTQNAEPNKDINNNHLTNTNANANTNIPSHSHSHSADGTANAHPNVNPISPSSSTSTVTLNSEPPDSSSSSSSSLVIPSPSPSRVSSVFSKKIIVNFQSVGSAPLLKKNKFSLSAKHKYVVILEFLRKQLTNNAASTCSPSPSSSPSPPTSLSLFTFVSSSFSPSPDSLIDDLFNSFAVNNELIIHYATQDAWG